MPSVYDGSSMPNPEPKPFPPQPGYGPPQPGVPYGTEPVKKKSGWGCVGCLVGCLGVMLILAIAAGIGTYMFIQRLPDMARGLAEQMVNESDLSPDDKKMVMKQVDRLVVAYKEGKIDGEKFGKLAEKLTKSPLMNMMIAYGAKVKYIDSSGLTPEEKAEAEKVLNRTARGAIEDKISKDKLDVALNHISNPMPNGGRQFRDTVSDEELRAFIKECKTLADDAGIPDEIVEINIGNELARLVDETLGEKTVPETSAEAVPSPEEGKPVDAAKPKPAEPEPETGAEKATEKAPEASQPADDKKPADAGQP